MERKIFGGQAVNRDCYIDFLYRTEITYSSGNGGLTFGYASNSAILRHGGDIFVATGVGDVRLCIFRCFTIVDVRCFQCGRFAGCKFQRFARQGDLGQRWAETCRKRNAQHKCQP